MLHLPERRLRKRYPEVKWDEPQAVKLIGTNGQRFACRYCVALNGLHGSQVPYLPADPDEVRTHIREAHGR